MNGITFQFYFSKVINGNIWRDASSLIDYLWQNVLKAEVFISMQ